MSTSNFNISLNEKERDVVLSALSSLRDEYFSASNEVKSSTISEDLRVKARSYSALFDRFANLVSLDTLDSEIEKLVNAKRPIDAIKLVRAITGLGLKEAKDRVDAVRERMNPVSQ